LFSRIDVLNRHLRSLSTEEPPYPCRYCKRHRGPDGFKRRDHLLQHIRNYHHHEQDAANTISPLKYYFPTCPRRDCPHYRDESFPKLPRSAQEQNKPFNSQAAYTKHMRDEHNQCTFPCDVAGCDRVGRRGYFREKDLLKHRKNQHPDALQYQITKRKMHVVCTESNCDAVLAPSSIRRHILEHADRSAAVASNEKEKLVEQQMSFAAFMPTPTAFASQHSSTTGSHNTTTETYEDFGFTAGIDHHMDFSI